MADREDRTGTGSGLLKAIITVAVVFGVAVIAWGGK
jgi:hypothetical protein